MRFCLAILALVFGLNAEARAEISVTGARIGLHEDVTRFVLDLSGEPAYEVFTLAEPARVVIDLPELNWRIAPTASPRPGGLISALRHGLFRAGVTRVVLDLRAAAKLKQVFVLGAKDGLPNRLVIDLQRAGPGEFAGGEFGQSVRSDRALPKVQEAALTGIPKVLEDDRPTVVIDAGHGGVDPGAVGVSGLYEKKLVLDYAVELKAQLESLGRYRVVMTRDRDIFIKLRDRIQIAQQAGGDLFVSIHANTNPSRNLRGAAIYTLSETASDAEAEALAKKENLSDVVAGLDFGNQTEDVNKILIDLAQRETMNLSKRFAGIVIEEIRKNAKTLGKPHRSAGFAVLKSPTVPSILFEIGYMSNQAEEKLLLSAAHRKNLVASMVRAIGAYFDWQQSFSKS